MKKQTLVIATLVVLVVGAAAGAVVVVMVVATDVADLVKWGVKSLKVDSVEIANVTHAFNQTYPELSDSLVQAGYTGV